MNDFKYYFIISKQNVIFFDSDENIIDKSFIFTDFDSSYIRLVLSVVKHRMILLSDLWNKFPYFFSKPYIKEK